MSGRTKLLSTFFVLVSVQLFMPAAASATTVATKAEAEAMVKRGTMFINKHGTERAFAEFSNKDGQFVDRDLYLVAYRMDGVVLAHGGNKRLIGKNLLDIRDIDGKAFVKERIDLAKRSTSFWQEYKFLNPSTGNIESKLTYCMPHDGIVVCGGIYAGLKGNG
jgi:cytochrome c